MKKLVHIGAGSHARKDHLPQLARYQAEHPGNWELAALCDLDPTRAREAAAEFGFARSFTSLHDMMHQEQPDACVLITPHNLTATLTTQLLGYGVPLLIEKPIGTTASEIDAVCAEIDRTGTPVMVSMNRRFDSAITAAIAWIDHRPIRTASAAIRRNNRREDGFIEDAALHPVDTLRHLIGDLTVETRVAFGRGEGALIQLRGPQGQPVILQIAPDAGQWEESYELIGDGFRVHIYAAIGWRAWENGKQVVIDDQHDIDPAIRRGAYGETAAFLSAVHHGTALSPTPHDVRNSELITLELGRWRRAIADTPTRPATVN